MTNSSLSSEKRESEVNFNVNVNVGVPQIAIDLFVKKDRKGIRFFDAFGNLRYKVADIDASPLSAKHSYALRRRVLLDSSSNPLVSIVRSPDGSWKGFKGAGFEELLFTVQQTINTFNKIECNILLSDENGANLTFALRGCVFWRTCTIYQDKFIIAQTNLMYKLGFRKHFVGRSKFRVTVFPGFSEYSTIASLIVVFLDGRKQ